MSKTYLNSKQVRQRYGNVSDMSLYRWENDPAMGFPKPVRINGRRLWDEAELEAYERGQIARRVTEAS